MTLHDLHRMPRELPATISVERAGELLGVSRRAAYRAVDAGQLPVIRVGRRLLVPTAKLLDLLGVAGAQQGDASAAGETPRTASSTMR